ncbi:hypothetical protein [Actinophytocola sp.]|uniref:hypothetical protein n=1 Tax=Actinophytocola sp. TaxID=1872138 RepID=UPI002D7E597F|nr:hypothetical protein [Actinophytocola sp.]HET9141990.1 hypothetical protein [Actinophytocola sp.]
MTTSAPGAPVPDDEPDVAHGTESSVQVEPTAEPEPPAPSDVPEPESKPPPWLFEPYSTSGAQRIRETPRPGFLVAGSAILLLVGGLVAVVAFFAMKGPVEAIAGSARAGVAVLDPVTTNTSETPATSGPVTTSGAPAVTPSDDPSPTANPGESAGGLLALLAAHPLSSSPMTMPNTACALHRFDPADDRQLAFFQEAKVCADAAWAAVLDAAGIPAPGIDLVVVQGAPVATPCGPVNPTDPATQCRSTVYMTPAHLRDVEGNGRYPGRYFGVFLRTYAKAVQEVTGLAILHATARSQPDARIADLDTRLAQQATCLAGVAAGAMSGQGAVDANITKEIHDRLSDVDAPADASAWLDKGYQTRSLAACNSWAE